MSQGLPRVAIGLAILCAPLASTAQQAGKIPRIGFLGAVTPEDFPHLEDAFREGFREAGYVEGRSLVIEYRWEEGRARRNGQVVGWLVLGANAAASYARRPRSRRGVPRPGQLGYHGVRPIGRNITLRAR